MGEIMAEDFSFSRDYRNIKWGPTLKYNMLRALCAGIVVTAIGLIFYDELPNNNGANLRFIATAWIIIPLGYPFFYLPMGIVLRFLGSFFSPFLFVAFCFSSMIAIGDPLVFLLHKAVRNVVPVRKPAFLSFQMLIFVLDDGLEPDIHMEPDIHVESDFYDSPQLAPAAHNKRLRNETVKPSPSQYEDGSVEQLLDTCQRDPHQGLAWIDAMSPELRSRRTISFARFVALTTLALEEVTGAVNLAGVEPYALRRLMTKESIKYVVQALQQVSEIERLHPGYIASLGTPGDRFAESSMDDICIVVDRLIPGTVQEMLGWTKIFYFGIDRIGFVPGVKDQIPHSLLTTLLKTRFAIPEICRSAVAIACGTERTRLRYVDFYLCRLLYSEAPTLRDAEILGILRLLEDSSFTFTLE